jgi:transposase
MKYYCSRFGFVFGASMNALSIDLRERILAACDKENATREQVAKRFRVSLGMVKNLWTATHGIRWVNGKMGGVNHG